MLRSILRKIANKLLFITQTNIKTSVEISYLQPNNRLLNKRVLITGGSKGIGYAIAKKFIKEGAKVIITGRNEDDLKKASTDIGCYYIIADALNHNNIIDSIDRSEQILGGIDILVNNAGISLHEGNIRNVSEESFDKQININLKASYFYAKEFINNVEKNRINNASILFVSSERGTYVDDLPYGLTKVAINSLTQGLGKLLIKNNIRVNAIAPGITATQLTGFSEDNLSANYATGRVYLSDEVAEVACFLVSDSAKCLSGQILTCDNGNSVNSYRK